MQPLGRRARAVGPDAPSWRYRRDQTLAVRARARRASCLDERVERAVALARRDGARPSPRRPCRSRRPRPVGGRARGAARRRPLLLPRAARPRRLRAGGLGAAVAVEARGPGASREVAARVPRARPRARSPTIRPRPGRPPAAGPVFVGGFAFAHDGGAAPEWASLAPAQLVLPEVALARQRRRGADDLCRRGRRRRGARRARASGSRERLAELAPGADAAARPRPGRRARGWPARRRRRTTRRRCARAVERIARRRAREGRARARGAGARAAPARPGAGARRPARGASPPATASASGTPELAFVGASPELLVRRDGARAQTVALAGTTRRSADPAVDDHLGEQLLRSAKDRDEQAIVARRIERTLDPVSLWVAAADEPVLVKVQNVQHLATPIRAQLARAGAGGRAGRAAAPDARRRRRAARGGRAADPRARGPRPRLVRRRRSAGPTSPRTASSAWRSAARCSAARSPTSTPATASCATPIPADELAETEVKLQALLPLLA